MQFYIMIDGESVGPLTQSDIESKLEDGSVGRDALVWHEGLESWQPIGQVFSVEVVKAPPPLPPVAKPSPPPVRRQQCIENHLQEENAEWFRRPVFKIGLSLVAATLVLAGFLSTGKRNDAGSDLALRQIEELKEETRKLSEELQQARQKADSPVQTDTANQPTLQSAMDAEKSAIATTSAAVSEPARPATDKEPPVDVGPRLKLIGPKILGIQLGDKVESVCQKFNAEYASNMNGQRMEVRKLASDGTFVCSTPDGLRAAEQLDKLNKPAGDGKPEDLLGGLLLGVMVGGQGVMQAQMAQGPIIYADKDGVIWKYVMGTMATNNFFGRAAFMSNREFASFLSAKYELPDLEGEMVETKDPFSNSTDYVPKYHGFSSDGFSVQIDEHKAIFIEKL